MNEFVMAFDSSQQALRTEMLLEQKAIMFEMIPTPSEITAGCALSLSFSVQEVDRIMEIVKAEHIEIRGVFRSHPSSASGDSSFEQWV